MLYCEDMKRFLFPRIPSVSEYSSRANWEKAVWEIFEAYFKKEKELNIFSILLTSDERHMVANRIAAVDRILSGASYRKIGEELWLSSQTISSIKKALKDEKYRSYYERGKTERKVRKYSPRPISSEEKARQEGKRRWRTKFGTRYITY